MTRKHTERHKANNGFHPESPEGRADTSKPNGAAHHEPSYFTGAATGQAPEGKEGPALGGTASQSGDAKLYTGDELRSIARYAYKLGYTLGHRTGHRCQAEHDLPVIRNQRDRLQRAGDTVGRLKAALILSNTALAQSTAALVD